MYLVIIDYFSRWIDVKFLKRSVSETVVKKMLSIYARFGDPDIIITDGGPQFSCKYFQSFIDRYYIQHQISEKAVQVTRRLMRISNSADALMVKCLHFF